MKNGKYMLILSLFLMPFMAMAQGHKVGVVNANRVVQQCQKGKAFFEELSQFEKSKKAELEQLAAQFQAKQKDASAKAASMSEDKKREISLELEALQRDLKRMSEDAERETNAKLSVGLEKFQKELGPLIRQIALEQGLHMVFNDGPSSGIVFRDDSVDITDAVIKKYDELNQ